MEQLTKKQKNLLDRIKNEPHKIGHLVGLDKLTPLHSEWIKGMLFDEDDYYLLTHRTAYTTTTVCLAVALNVLLRPHLRTVLYCENKHLLDNRREKILQILHSETFEYFSQVLYDKQLQIYGDRHKKNYIIESWLPSLVFTSEPFSICCFDNDYIFLDEYISAKDGCFKKLRDKHKDLFEDFKKNSKKVSHDPKIILTGQKQHKEDLWFELENVNVYDVYRTGLLSDKEIEENRLIMTPKRFTQSYFCRDLEEE